MRARRLIDEKDNDWNPAQYTELLRLREAEALGAFELLRVKLGTLRGLAAEQKVDGYKKLRLTSAGYRRFIFYLSQDARTYFESKGAEAKYVFETRSVQGKRLFTKKGILTQRGIEAYNRIQRKLPVFWKYPDGRVTGTVRPPKSLTAPVRRVLPPKPAKKKLGRKSNVDRDAVKRITALMRSGYVEIKESEARALLKATKMTEEELVRDSSLQVIATKEKTFYLLSPSDPMMALVTQSRSGGKSASMTGSPTMK